MSMLEGKRINFIRHNGGIIAGQPTTIDLHITGSIITVTDNEEVNLIDKILKEFDRLTQKIGICGQAERMVYLSQRLMQEGW